MNANAQVMKYFPEKLTSQQSDALVDRIQKHFDNYGYGLWAVEIKEEISFAGFVGLAIPQIETHFTPCVEIGWRLDETHWGNGYATEGALAVLDFAFCHLQLSEVVSMTTVGNIRSRRVMEKIGMTSSPTDDFDHPSIPENHPLQRHVLYRVKRTMQDQPDLSMK